MVGEMKVIGISTEMACAVTGTPFERVSQYLKRGQFSLELAADKKRRAGREWLVLDVVRLAVLKALTDIGIAISAASPIARDWDGTSNPIKVTSAHILLTVDPSGLIDAITKKLETLA